MTYKRILTIKPEYTSDLLSHNIDETHIRPANGGIIGEYVIEVPDTKTMRRHADKLVDLFNNS